MSVYVHVCVCVCVCVYVFGVKNVARLHCGGIFELWCQLPARREGLSVGSAISDKSV